MVNPTGGYAQAKRNKSQWVVSAGYGAPSIIRTFLKKNNTHNDYKIVGWGPYMVKAEYRITPRWGVGLNFTYSFSRLSFMADGYDTTTKKIRPFEYGVEMEDMTAILRTNYHFYRSEKWQGYVGAGIGYGRIVLGTYSTAPLNQFSVGYSIPRPLSLEATVGLRYFITKHLGLYTELGLGKSWVLYNKYFIPESLGQLGVTVKF